PASARARASRAASALATRPAVSRCQASWAATARATSATCSRTWRGLTLPALARVSWQLVASSARRTSALSRRASGRPAPRVRRRGALAGGEGVAGGAAHDMMGLAEGHGVGPCEGVGEVAGRAPEGARLGGHDLAAHGQGGDALGEEPERAEARVAHRRQDVV